MGHYASEMDPDFNKSREEIEQWLAAGFKLISRQADMLKCPVCKSVVCREDWRDHIGWHGRPITPNPL